MYVDLPNISRCCFCIPLRHGLLVWAYIKLIWCLFLIVMIIIRMSTIPGLSLEYLMTELIIPTLFTVSLVIEFVITVVFVVGAHKKNPKLLRVYYMYGFVVLVILFILYLLAVSLASFQYFYYMRNVDIQNVYDSSLFGAGVLLFNLYLLSLIRSEILKLENNAQFRFQNLVTEPTCHMANDKQ